MTRRFQQFIEIILSNIGIKSTSPPYTTPHELTSHSKCAELFNIYSPQTKKDYNRYRGKDYSLQVERFLWGKKRLVELGGF